MVINMNKRGWIRVVEAFVAVLLITGVLLIIINKGYIGKKDISNKVYDAELSILREIELNDSLRTEILSASPLPSEWEDIGFPIDVKDKIEARSPEYLICVAKICELDEICIIENIDKDVYAQAVAITATNEIYKPRQLKLFCWEK